MSSCDSLQTTHYNSKSSSDSRLTSKVPSNNSHFKSHEIAIFVSNLTKIYPLYDKPTDRMKEALHPLRKKCHHDFFALKDVSFEIKKGETVGIIGKNGAGKSTLLKILTGVLTPTSGEVLVNGRVSSLLELGTGFNPELSGLENIYFYGTINGISREEMNSKKDDIIDFADIGEFINQPVKTYSSGMMARLGFAVAINIEPEILIVDEALSVGDMKFVFKCMSKFKEIQCSGATIIFVSHDIQSIKTLCNKSIWLNMGELIRYGDSKGIANEYIRELFHGYKSSYSGDNSPNKIVEKSGFNSQSLIDIPLGVTRWGTGELAITKFSISTEGNNDNLKYLDKISICYIAEVKKTGEYSNLTFAFSIRNGKNLDIIVDVVKYTGGCYLKQGDIINVQFEFENILVAGDYSLILALEDRNGLAFEYFDYIENVHIFKVVSDYNYNFGIARPKIKREFTLL